MNRIILILFICLVIVISTIYSSIQPLPQTLQISTSDISRYQVLDRRGTPLSVTYKNELNTNDIVRLDAVPELLKKAFILAEDKNFYSHNGIDWLARFTAIWQNLRHLRTVRGASTISEQVVKILHPRKRNLWSRVIETFESYQLERRFSKNEILEFYINQVPYANQRRGVVQAARYYWDRDLNTLSEKEQLALVVLVRAPSRYDLYKKTTSIDSQINSLAKRLAEQRILTQDQVDYIKKINFQLKKPKFEVQADHFVRYVLSHENLNEISNNGRITTTLDGSIQNKVQSILDNRLKDLASKKASNAAALIVDNSSNEIIAWVNGGSDDTDSYARQFDAVVTKRQPGSTLKPFLYALALTKGWTPATIILDAPLAQAVGLGLHSYRNYSRVFYGNVKLREALANSLNIPAIRTIQFTGVQSFLNLLLDLGVKSLDRESEFYGEGLALGNGEITLYELVNAYTVFSNNGVLSPLQYILTNKKNRKSKEVFDDETTSLIGDILSDPTARRLEFNSSLMDFPIQTAIKTGTSTDYRDAWAVGYSSHYTVGVWIGNFDRSSMKEISGASGPVLALRSIFSELHKNKEPERLYLSSKLVKKRICTSTGLLARENCPRSKEYFHSKNVETRVCDQIHDDAHSHTQEIKLELPTNNLQIAIDPRIPIEMQAFNFTVSKNAHISKIEWIVDKKSIAVTAEPTYLWKLERGKHTVQAKAWLKDEEKEILTDKKNFWVK